MSGDRLARNPIEDAIAAVSIARAAVMHGSWDKPGQHQQFLRAIDSLNSLNDFLLGCRALARLDSGAAEENA